MERNLKLNPRSRIVFAEPVAFHLPTERTSYILSPSVATLLARLSTPLHRRAATSLAAELLSLNEVEGDAFIASLLSKKILVEDGSVGQQISAEGWDKWSFDALLFHCRTRDLAYVDSHVQRVKATKEEYFRNAFAREGPPEFWKRYPNVPSLPMTSPTSRLAHGSDGGVCLTKSSLADVMWAGHVEAKELRLRTEKEWRADPSILIQSYSVCIETYALAVGIDDLPPGLYHYDMRSHELCCLRESCAASDIDAVISLEDKRQLACVLIVSAVWIRYMYRYRTARAYRTLMLRVGEFSQNLLTVAHERHVLASLAPVAEESRAASLLALEPAEEAPLFAMALFHA